MVENENKLDSYDRRILFELDKNARATAVQIGKQIRKSKQFVDYRIKKMEEAGMLKGYVSVIDYSRLGYYSVRIYFKFRNISPDQQKQIESELIKDREVWWLVTLEGVWDIGYAMVIKNLLDFYDYWDKTMKKYRKFVSKRSVVIYTHIKQFPKSYLIGKPNTDKGTLVGASKEVNECSDFDINLLKILSDNGRMSLLDISTKLKTSPQVVKNHMQKLEGLGIIQGYRALIDVSSFGYRYYKAYINLIHTDRIQELENFCLRHQNILNVNRNIGGRDFEIELQAKSFEEFEKIMGELREDFIGVIDDFEFVVAREEKKMNYFPFGV
jgi:Lrp/AsnC family transcriptional regulator, leucine-responsive regulatory protein